MKIFLCLAGILKKHTMWGKQLKGRVPKEPQEQFPGKSWQWQPESSTAPLHDKREHNVGFQRDLARCVQFPPQPGVCWGVTLVYKAYLNDLWPVCRSGSGIWFCLAYICDPSRRFSDTRLCKEPWTSFPGRSKSYPFSLLPELLEVTRRHGYPQISRIPYAYLGVGASA